MRFVIKAINIKSSQSVKVNEVELTKEELEALVASRYKNDHKLVETKNIIYRAEIQDNVNT